MSEQFERWWSNENTFMELPAYDPSVEAHDKWLARMAYNQAIKSCVEFLMQPQPTNTGFCCLSNLSKAAETIKEKFGSEI